MEPPLSGFEGLGFVVLSFVLTRGGHGMNVKEGDGAIEHSGECHFFLRCGQGVMGDLLFDWSRSGKQSQIYRYCSYLWL